MSSKQCLNAKLGVAKVGFGMAALGRPGYITLGHADDLNQTYAVESMQAHAHTVLDAAWAGGVRYFDAARSYGKAETFLGSWLTTREIAADQIVVGSKWGYTYTANWRVTVDAEKSHEVKEHSLPVLERQWSESGAIFGEQLDLYQIHSATLESGVLDNTAVLERLAQIRDVGTVVGLSVSGAQQGKTIERALEIEIDGTPLFGALQATWNLLEQSATHSLQAASDQGLFVIVKEAVANGRLTERNAARTFGVQMDLLRGSARDLDTTVDALAIAAAIQQPWSDVVLSGAARVAHVASNLAALGVAWDGSILRELAPIRETAEGYWAMRSALAWN